MREDRPDPGLLLDVASVLSGLNHDIEAAEIVQQASRCAAHSAGAGASGSSSSSGASDHGERLDPGWGRTA